MILMAVFGGVVIVMLCGGVLLARITTAPKSKRSWIWGCVILIALICVPLFLLGLGAWFIFFDGISAENFNPFGG